MDRKRALCGLLLTRFSLARNVRIKTRIYKNNQKIKDRVLPLLGCRWDQMD